MILLLLLGTNQIIDKLRSLLNIKNDHICNIHVIAVHGIKLKDLQPCTEYDLVVIAVNKNGHCSEEAHITAKTHYFKKHTIPLIQLLSSFPFLFLIPLSNPPSDNTFQ